MLRKLARARADAARTGLARPSCPSALRVDPLQLEPVLETLVALDWIGAARRRPAAPRYVLLCDPAATPVAPLLSQLLLAPSPVLRGFWERAGFGEMTLADVIAEPALSAAPT